MSVRIAIAAGVLSLGLCPGCFGQQSSLPAQVARLPTDTLQLTPANDPADERWIVWDAFVGDAMSAHIALCDRAGTCRWSHSWPDAYEPSIRLMGPWSTDRLSLFLVTYQQGAAAETAVVIGLSPGRLLTIYDQRDGAWVAVAADNTTVLIDQDPGSHVDLDCLQWNDAARRLRKVHCRPILVGGKGYFP